MKWYNSCQEFSRSCFSRSSSSTSQLNKKLRNYDFITFKIIYRLQCHLKQRHRSMSWKTEAGSLQFLVTNLSCGLNSIKWVQDGGLRWSKIIKTWNSIWSHLMNLVASRENLPSLCPQCCCDLDLLSFPNSAWPQSSTVNAWGQQKAGLDLSCLFVTAPHNPVSFLSTNRVNMCSLRL